MSLLYDLFSILFGLIYLPYAIVKGKLRLDGFLMRLGIFSRGIKAAFTLKPALWFHAVSVGEVAALNELICLAQKEYPDYSLVISTITRTGNLLAKKLFSKGATIIYLPFDISFIVRRVVSIIQPRLFILCETELWPNIILALAQKNVPIILVNGRMSEASFRGYRLINRILRPILGRVALFCMQTEQYKERLRSLGVEEKKIQATGNMKFDILAPPQTGLATTLRSSLKDTEQLFIAASTHQGEEAIILNVHKRLSRLYPCLRLLIAPRHIERIGEIERLVKTAGFEPLCLSSIHHPPSTIHHPYIFLLDTIGELASIYRIASVVFMGGSLVNKGGHNPIEPAILERPIISGHYVSNFQDIYETFIKNDAAVLVRNEKELFDSARGLLDNKDIRASLGFRARGVVEENKGATEKTLEAIKAIVNISPHSPRTTEKYKHI